MGKFVPLKNRVLVKRKQQEEKTKSGLIIPSTVAAKSNEAEVLAVGGGRVTSEGVVIPVDVKPGNIVIFNKHAGYEIKLDSFETFPGEALLVLSEDDILAVIE